MSDPITTALQASDDPMAAPTWLPWRTGRKVGRTIYAQVGAEPSDDDRLIGVMDTPGLATEAVDCHNGVLGRVQDDQGSAEHDREGARQLEVRQQLEGAVEATLADMELHEDLPVTFDVGYMAAWRELRDAVDDAFGGSSDA